MRRTTIITLFTASLLALATTGCKHSTEQKNEPVTTEKVAIGFGVDVTEQTPASPTRGTGVRSKVSGLESTGVFSFYARAYKHADADMTGVRRQTVINDYQVEWTEASAGSTLSNTHDWEYVGIGTNQTIKYWDWSAKQYRFFGYVNETNREAAVSPATAASADDMVTVTYSDTDLKYLTTPLYSRLKMVAPGQYGQYVPLEFAYAVAMVEVKFYMGADPQGRMHLSNIRFTPADHQDIPTRATRIVVTYPIAGDTPEMTTETLTVTPLTSTTYKIANLPFKDYTIPYDSWQTMQSVEPALDNPGAGTTGSLRIPNTYCYAMLPAPSNPAFVMSLKLEEEEKSATIPAQYMQWKANTHYTYIFKLTADLELVLEDILVDGWSVEDIESEETTW